MALTEANYWPDSGVLNGEDPLNPGVNGAENPKLAKQLACARCHGQKLRCVRRTSDARICDRCLRANVECASRQPQRLGRPADASARRSARTGRSHADRGGYAVKVRSPLAKRRQRHIRDPPANPSPAVMAVDNGSTATTQFEPDWWAWYNPLTNLPIPTYTSDLPQDNGGASSSTPAPPSTGFISYAIPFGDFGTPNTLFPIVEELSSLFPSGIDVASLSPLPTQGQKPEQTATCNSTTR